MRRLRIVVAILVSMGSTACVSHPQTADEFRKAVPGALTAKIESFEVARPFDEVAGTFQEMAPACLNKRIKTTSQTRMSYQVIVTAYKPTVLVGADKAELHVQMLHEQGVLNVSKVPEGGYYLLVADAQPVGEGKTRIDLYRPSIGHGVLVKAVRGWATGEQMGCPDLTQ